MKWVLALSLLCAALACGKGDDEDLKLDPDEARRPDTRALQKKCAAADVAACDALAGDAIEPEEHARYELAAAEARAVQCDKGDKMECRFGALFFEDRSTDDADQKRAAVLYRKACELGDDIACFTADTLETRLGIARPASEKKLKIKKIKKVKKVEKKP